MKSKIQTMPTLFALLFCVLASVSIAGENIPRQNVRAGFFPFEETPQSKVSKQPESGYGYHLLQMIRLYTNWNFEYNGYGKSWNTMLSMLERGEIDLLAGVSKTSERLKKYDFSDQPVGYSGVLLTVKAGSRRYQIHDYSNWNGIRIGVIEGNSENNDFAAFAKEKHFSYQEIPFADMADLNRALQEERIDAVVCANLRELENEWIFEQLDFKPFYIAVKKGNLGMLREVNAALKRLEVAQPGFAKMLQEQYYKENRQANAAIHFSNEEQNFLRKAKQENRTFSVLANPDRAPFSSFRNGEFNGVMADILTLVGQRTGLRFSVLPALDHNDYYQQLKSGRAELVLDLRHDFAHAERLKYLLSDSYLSASLSILKRKSFKGIPRRIGIIRHSNMEYIVEKDMPGKITLVPYPSFSSMIDALQNGECDGGYVFTRTAENIILNDRSGSLTLASDGHLVNFAVGVNETCDPLLYSIIRKTMQSISTGETRRILLTHNASGVRQQSFREFLSEHVFSALSAILFIFLLLTGALIVALRSRVRMKHAHIELERNTRMWKILLDTIPIHIFAKDLNNHNRYVFCNKALCDFFELPESQVLGKSNFELFGDDNSDKVQALDAATMQSWESEAEQTAEVTDQKGKKRAFRLVKKMFQDGEHAKLMLGTATEITELEAQRKRAEENAEWFKRTLNAIGDGIITTDEKGNILMINPVAERMTGVPSAEAVGRPHEEVFHIVSSLDDQPTPSPVTRTIRTGNIVELANHTDLLHADGTRYHIADSSAPIRDRNGKITGAILVFRDVTEEYLHRDQLRQALSGLEYAAGLSRAAFFSMNVKDRKLLSCSKEFPSLWPVRNGIVIPVEEHVWQADLEGNQKTFEALLSRKIDVAVLNYRALIHGELRNYQIRATLDDSDRANPAFVGVIQDVTEWTRKEQKLADTLKLWDSVLDIIPVMIFVKDADDDFRYLVSNRRFEQFMGHTHEEIIGKCDRELFQGEEFEPFLAKDEDVIRDNAPTEFTESPRDAAGNQLHLRTTKIPLIAADGKHLLLGVSVDMTAETMNRNAMEKLQEEQADLLKQHEFLLEAMPFYVFIQDADNDFRYLYCNEACAESLGRPVAEVIGKNNYELFLKRESADRSLEYCRKAMAAGGMCEDRQIYTAPDGIRHVGRAFRKAIRLADGRNWLLGMVTDITELSELAQNQKTINDCFSAMLIPGARNSEADVVEQICRRLDAARGYLIRFDTENGQFIPRAEFLGVASERKPLESHPLTPDNKLYLTLTRTGLVSAPNANDPEIVEQFGLWREENIRYGLKSIYCALVSVNGKPWGYIGVTYESECRRLSDREQDFLVSGAHLTGVMLEREYYAERQTTTINSLRNHKFLMDYGAALTRSGMFRLNPATLEIQGSDGLEKLLPIRDGKAFPAAEWIANEDMPEIRRKLGQLYAGDVSQTTFTFRSDHFGEPRHYRMLFSRDENSKDGVCFGAIQDISEITIQSEKLRETMELWNTVLGLIPVMIFAKRADDHFRYTLANKAFETFSGKSQDQILGRTDAEIFNRPSDLAWFEEHDNAVMRAGKAQTINEDVVGADGLPHTFRTTKLPFIDANGRPQILASSVDVTELKALISNLNVLNACLEIFFRADDTAEAIRSVLKNIAEHLNADYVYVLEIDPTCAAADTVAEYGTPKILSGLKNHTFDPGDESFDMLLRGEDCFLADLHDPKQRQILKSWSEYLEKFDMRSIYFCGIRQGGKLWGDLGVIYTGESHRLNDLTKQFLRSAAHLIEMILEREQTAARLKTALERAQAADRAKSLFLASMSHEIRTPLNAVIGFSELLLDGTLPENERKDYLSGISSAGNALLALINDVLDLSKLEAGQMVLSPTSVDFAELLKEVCMIFSQKCAERKIYLHRELPQQLPAVRIDKLRVRQILFNLIGNAVKFTDHGGITVQVEFKPDSEQTGTLAFQVRDTGCGIAEKDQQNLFQMFVQGGSAANARMHQEGTGLGLAICHRLIQQMNGSIKLTSTPGQGSVFAVTLRQVPFSTVAASTAATPTLPIAGKARILLVDDVPMNLKVMSALMKKINLEPLMASGALEALNILEKESVDFVLTDLWMPDMNGAELARRIRAKSKFAGIRIAAVTADTDGGENFDMSVFDTVVTKPITSEKLSRAIAQYHIGSEEIK